MTFFREDPTADQILDLDAHRYYPAPKKTYTQALADNPKSEITAYQ